MKLKNNIKKKVNSLILLTMLILPIFFSVLSSNSPNLLSEKEPEIDDKEVLRASNGPSYGANDFQLTTEWINSFGTLDNSNLPYQEITKSLIGDFNGDGSDDFIIADSRQIWVYDVNGTELYYERMIPGKQYRDIDIGNFSDAPGVDLLITTNDSMSIRSYPGIDIMTVAGVFHTVEVADIDPNSPYDEIIATNYSLYWQTSKPSTVRAYNASGSQLWSFNDTIRNTDFSLYYIEAGHDLDGDGNFDDIAAFTSDGNPYRNLTIYAIDESGGIIYTWATAKDNPDKFGDYAIGNFNISTPGEEIAFTSGYMPVSLMIYNVDQGDGNASLGWYYPSASRIETLMAGSDLIENSGARDDLLFGYTSGDDYIIEIRNGTDATMKNWSIPSGALEDDNDPQIAISDIDNDNKDEVIYGDSSGYITVYNNPGTLRWKTFLGSEISLVKCHDLLGNSELEVIVHPIGHIIVLQNNNTKLLDIGNSKVLHMLSVSLDSDAYDEVLAIFNDNRIVAIDNDGTKLWEHISTTPIIEITGVPGYIANRFGLMDKDNDGIDDYLYITSGQLWHDLDSILDMTGPEPTELESGLWSGVDVLVGDFDRDGYEDDFAVVGYGLEVLTPTDIGLQTLWYNDLITIPYMINIVFDATKGDFNGDTYDDLACTFWTVNTTGPSPTNKTVMAFNGLNGDQIFRYDGLYTSHSFVEAGDLDSDGTDEVVVGYSIYNPYINITAVKRSGSSGVSMWNQTLGYASKQIKIGEFTNDTTMDVAVTTWANELKVFNGIDGTLETQYNGLSHVNLVSGSINNENGDDDLISGSIIGGYSTVNVFTRNYSLGLPVNLNRTLYPVYQDGDISYVQVGDLSDGIKDNIIVGTEKGTIFCLEIFDAEELADFDLEVKLENRTCCAGEYLEVNFIIERNEPDVCKKIEMGIYEWGSGITKATYIMEDELIDVRIEPGITKITAKLLIPVDLKGKHYIGGKIHYDNFTDSDFLNNADEKNFVTKPFDILGKSSYTYIQNVEVNDIMEHSKFIEVNITLENTQTVDDDLTLNISATNDVFVLNKTSEIIQVSAGNTINLVRSIYIPFKLPRDIIALFGSIYVTIEGNQGMDSSLTIMRLSDTNTEDVGQYMRSVEIYNSTGNSIVELTKANISNYVWQVNRSLTKNVENYTAEVTLYNDYNFDIYIGGGYLITDYLGESSLFSNETGEPGVAFSPPGGLIIHSGKTELVLTFNFSFSQADLEGVHTMYLILLSVSFNTLRLESAGFQLDFNLTSQLNNTLYFTDEYTISDAIVQNTNNITATANINFTSIPATDSNITTIIHLQDIANESHWFNITKVYDIGGLNSLEINMTINTNMFSDTLVQLYLAVLCENYSKIIVPRRMAGIQGAIVYIIKPEKIYSFETGSTTRGFSLDYGNVSITINPTSDITISINSFDAWTNPETKFLTDMASDQIDAIGFWSITPNKTVSAADFVGDISMTMFWQQRYAITQGIHSEDLHLYFFNETTLTWDLKSGAVLNTDDNSFQVSVSHLSIFAIGGLKDEDTPQFEITTTFTNGKTQNPQILISWTKDVPAWDYSWDRVSLYLDGTYLNDATNNSQTFTLPSVEKLYTIKAVAHDDFTSHSDQDEITVWNDLDTVTITDTSDDVVNNGDVPSPGYLKLTWQGSPDILYYQIKVNGKVLETTTDTSYEFIFDKSGDYEIQILGFDSYGDGTVCTFRVSYSEPKKTSETSEVIDDTILMMVIAVSAIVAVIGVVLLVVMKDKTVDYSKVKIAKK